MKFVNHRINPLLLQPPSPYSRSAWYLTNRNHQHDSGHLKSHFRVTFLYYVMSNSKVKFVRICVRAITMRCTYNGKVMSVRMLKSSKLQNGFQWNLVFGVHRSCSFNFETFV